MDARDVYALLQGTLSPGEAERKSAEAGLRAMLTRAGFLALLLQVAGHSEVETPVRLAAITEFRRCVDKFWGRRIGRHRGAGDAPSVNIEDEERQAIRASLVGLVRAGGAGSSRALGVQMAVALSRVARHDFPHAWPALLADLHASVTASSGSGSPEPILAVYYVTKALASRRLPSDKAHFRSIADSMLGFACSEWQTSVERALGGSQAHEDVAVVCTRLIRRLLVSGVPDMSQSQPTQRFLQVVPYLLNTLAGHMSARSPQAAFALKLMKGCLKAVNKAQKAHPMEFVPYLDTYLKAFYGLFVSFGPSAIEEAVVVLPMRFIGRTLGSATYRTDLYRPVHDSSSAAPGAAASPPAAVAAGDAVQRAFFTAEAAAQFVRTMLQHYLVLGAEDLEMLAGDPEAVLSEEDANAWHHARRPCAETVFLQVLEKHKPLVAGPLLEALSAALQTEPATWQAVLAKDAVYAAAGLGAFELSDCLPVRQCLEAMHAELARTPAELAPVLRRRLAATIGAWSLSIGRELRPAAYSYLSALLRDEQLVVGLTAAFALKQVIDDMEFEYAAFAPYLETSLRALAAVSGRCREMQTRIRLVNSVTAVVQQAHAGMAPHARLVLEHLCALWGQVGATESPVRPHLLDAAAQLVGAVGTACAQHYDLLLALARLSLDPAQQDHSIVAEDALELLHGVLLAAPAADARLFELFPLVAGVLARSIEDTRVTLAAAVMQDMLVVGGAGFVRAYGDGMFAAVARALEGLNDQGAERVLRPMELAAVLDVSGSEQFAGLFKKALGIAVASESEDLLRTVFALLSRLLLHQPQAFAGLVARLQAQAQVPLMQSLLARWFDKFDYVGSLRRKKLNGMALVSLLALPDAAMLAYVDQAVNVAVETVLTLEDHGADRSALLETVGGTEGGAYNSGMLQWMQRDPVVTVDMRQYVAQTLARAAAVHGQAYAAALAAVDPMVLAQLQGGPAPPQQ
eukprot:m51a1_g11503 hypothetical protein (971) ;mRNA; f:6860-11246